MKFSLYKLIQGRDAFGHGLTLYYKGEEKHQSIQGGIATILVQVFTLILLVQALEEVYMMQEP